MNRGHLIGLGSIIPFALFFVANIQIEQQQNRPFQWVDQRSFTTLYFDNIKDAALLYVEKSAIIRVDITQVEK